jgi:2',3'-cyclic-nucleotide 2'-phosphodiesterase (5'-nucleotidase family)
MTFRFISALFLFFFTFNSCKERVKVFQTNVSHQSIANIAIDSSIYKKLLPYKEKLDNEMNEVVSVNEEALIKGQPEGNLGNFVTDCVMQKCKEYLQGKEYKIDAVLLNNGGLRVPLPKGKITKGKIFELMPFDNELVLVEMSGINFKKMLIYIAAKGGMPVSGIRMQINSKKEPLNVKINGNNFDSTLTYGVITSDYLADGGDNLLFFNPTQNKIKIKILLRDAILDYCREIKKQKKNILVKTDGRISFSE